MSNYIALSMLELFELFRMVIVLIGRLKRYPCFFGYIPLETCSHKSVFYNNLGTSRQFSTFPTILRRCNGCYWWLHFTYHLITIVALVSHSLVCVIRYMHWFRLVSHSYILPEANEDQLSEMPHRRPHSLEDEHAFGE